MAIGGVCTAVFVNADDTQDRLISVYDQGETYAFITNETTLGAALHAAGVTLDERDSIEPSRDEELVASSYQVNIYRVRPITVIDGTTHIRILSARRTVEQITQDAGITMHDEDIADLDQADVAHDSAGLTLTITRATPVTLDLYGKKTRVRTQASTVGELLHEKQLTLDSLDRLSLAKEASIREDMNIRIWREGIQTTSIKEKIPPSKRIIYDVNRPLGYRGVRAKGEPGIKTVVYQIEIKKGKEISRKQLSAVVSRKPKEMVEVIGLKNDGSGLTLAKGAQYFIDSRGVSHRETYYDLPMGTVMQACGQGGRYSVRPDGAKVDSDGYIIIAANYSNYPRCSIVETSLGPGKVYDTGGFAARHPHGFDLATDWSNPDGI